MVKEVVRAGREEDDYVFYKVEKIEDYKGVDGEKLLTHSFLMDTLRKVMGRTLTIIDASVSEKQQNKAMKDLVRQIFSDEMEFSAQWAFDQKKLDAMIPEDVDPKELGTVSIEQALGVEPMDEDKA